MTDKKVLEARAMLDKVQLAPPRTDWYPASVKPAHIGSYERSAGFMTVLDHWDGKRWSTFNDDRCWRGLKEAVVNPQKELVNRETSD